MLSTIFQPEVTTLESHIAQLQAQIAAAQQRITLLNEAELVADSAILALQGAVEKVSSLAPGAIANLKSAVLNLFQGGDNNPDDGNGNLPLEPAPQPNDDGGSEVVVELEQDSSAVDTQPADQETVAIALEIQQEQRTALDKLKAKLNRAYPWSVEQLPTEQRSSAVEAIAVNSEPLTGQ